ncbi:MAG: C1 family peptidase [Myxococcota bacterium]
MAQSLGSCDVIEVNGRTYPLDCLTVDYANIPWAAVAVIPRLVLSKGKGFAGAAPLPEMVDHRIDKMEGPIRDQGQTGTCTAASLASVVDQAIASQGGRPGHVSIMHLWSRYHTPSMSLAADGNRDRPVGDEASWPYSAPTACSWFSTCEQGKCSELGVRCGQKPQPAAISRTDTTARYRISNAVKLENLEPDTIRAVLAKGQDVWAAFRVTKAFRRPRGRNAVIPDYDGRTSRSGHAVAIVGYKTEPHGTYFLIKNSWGTDWGDGGYAWMHEKTLARNIYSNAYTIDVVPVGATPTPPGPRPPSPPTPPPRPPASCPGGMEPDSVTGRCVPPCADGSPRANGACADPRHCPPGYVNLFGFCAQSPTSTSGVDPRTGVRYRCGAGGCSYFIPTGTFGCTERPHCLHACAAPAYALAVGPGGVSCTE